MIRYTLLIFAGLVSLGVTMYGQAQDASSTARDLASQSELVKSSDTRTRVAAMHKVWNLGLAASDSENKIRAINLLKEPVNSSSDHIRMPAVFALAEIANSSKDAAVKIAAIEALRAPITASQVPIRDVAVDAMNTIIANARKSEIAVQAVNLLNEPVASGDNGVRIPAINAMANAVVGSDSSPAAAKAIDFIVAGPMNSASAIGGMEVRMMAIHAIERIGLDSPDTKIKTKAMVAVEAAATKSSFEPEARQRAKEVSARIQATIL